MALINTVKKVKVECKRELDFIWIVEDSKPLNEEWTEEIVNYCKDCQELVEIKKIKKATVCSICWWKKVPSGFKSSIKNYYKV